MSIPHFSQNVINAWISTFARATPTNLPDTPNYYLSTPRSLLITSTPQSFHLGTGEQLLSNIFDAFDTINHELLFVTCFWASSTSQSDFATALRRLSARALSLSPPRRIRVRICFSSSSLWQKLSHTSSLSGRIYPPSTWLGMFGLPDAEELMGLDVTVKSIFVRPFSVMHSKFVVADRERLWVPSCNVSWEEWFEGCAEVRGEVVGEVVRFWEEFWGRGEALPPLPPIKAHSPPGPGPGPESMPEAEPSPTDSASPFHIDFERGIERAAQVSLPHLEAIPTLLLPSPHHRNPRFRPLPFRFFSFIPFLSAPPPPPPTPLNTFLLALFSTAKMTIYIQSPNITSAPVLSAILSALKRGVNVRLVTNRKMMVLEQLITAGTLNEWALYNLQWDYSKCQNSLTRFYSGGRLEAGLGCGLGKLEIFYYQPRAERWGRGIGVKSHLKLTVVDDEIVVLGSGNMDRASWYTSQELGVAFFSGEFAKSVMDGVQRELEGCLERAF